MMHQGEIGLQDDQRTKLASEMSRAQAKSTEIQWTLRGEQQKLEQLLRAATLDEVAVLKEVDRILSLEQEMKRTQVTLLVRVRNTLTAEQQTSLWAARPRRPMDARMRPGQPGQWDRPRQQNRPGCR